jgi:hypothetical protein
MVSQLLEYSQYFVDDSNAFASSVGSSSPGAVTLHPSLVPDLEAVDIHGVTNSDGSNNSLNQLAPVIHPNTMTGAAPCDGND